MRLHAGKTLRATAMIAGAAAFGTVFSGTAFATDQPDDYATPDDYTTSASQKTDNSSSGNDTLSGLAPNGGSMPGLGDHHSFDMPRMSSTAPAVSVPASDDEHYGHGYEMPDDLYTPFEHRSNDYHCGSQRHQRYFHPGENGFGGYDGHPSDDCAYRSRDYHPRRTGFKRNPNYDYGYNGYLGTDERRNNKNHYEYCGPGHL
ncbi:MAG: hypothetical protein JO100_05240 [Pseudonocardia sp.]|nr:hypothetical protein [Pseudonocardia sp.]